MTNKIYEDGYYNEYQKNRYLDTLPDSSRISVERILNRAKPIEESFKEDLLNFNLHQIERLLTYLNPTTLNASRANFYVVQNYIQWGIEQNLRDNNLNPLDTLTDNAYYRKFVDQTKKSLYTKDEIYKMINVCNNAQDAVVLALIFEGVFGTKDYDELLNLREQHIKNNNYLELRDGNEKRLIQVSDDCMRLVRQALNEETYLKKNGEVSENLRSKPEVKLVENDFVLKNVDTQSKSDGKADKHLVLRRIRAVKDYNDDWVKTLTPYIIRNSGMLWMAKQLYDQYGKLEKEHYEAISVQFNIRKINNNGYESFNYFRLKNDFLNINKIDELYGEQS